MPNGWVEISLFEICWLEDGNQIHGEELVYWDAKALRGKNTKVKISYGKIVEQGKNVILVDGENSGEVFTIPYRGYLGSTFKILHIAPLVSQNFVRIILDYNRDLFRENKTGSAIPHLNKRLFKTMNVLLPPFLEQERIAKNVDLLLSQIDIIEQNQTGIEALYDELKKRTLDLAIQGKLVPQDENDEPASELLKRIRAEKKAKLGKKYIDSYIYKGDDNCYYEHFDGINEDKAIEVPFELPNNWAWAKLLDIGVFSSGKTPDMSIPEYWVNGNVQWFTSKDMKVKYLTNSQMKITDLAAQSMTIYPKGTLLWVVRSGILTRCLPLCILMLPSTINQDIKAYQLYNRQMSDYVYFMLKGFEQTILEKYVKKITTVHSLKFDELIKKFLVPIPPLAEQQRIVDRINEIFAKL